MTSNGDVVDGVFGTCCTILDNDSWGMESALELINNKYLFVVKRCDVVLQRTFEKEHLAPLPISYRKSDLFPTYESQRR